MSASHHWRSKKLAEIMSAKHDDSSNNNQGKSWPHGIWAAVPTPFLANQSLDFSGIAQNVRHFRDALGLAGIFCNGLMGEVWSLSINERRQILEATVAAADGLLPVGVVTSHASVVETLELSRHATDTRVDHIVLMRPPGLFSEHEISDFVRMIRHAVACKVVLFDSEAQSGGYPTVVIRQLAEEGCIDAVKCTRNADAITALRGEVGNIVPICDPYESHALVNLVRFGHHVLYADPEPYLYQAWGERLVTGYFENHFRGEFASMIEGHARLEPLRLVYERWIQMPLMRGKPINAALKHWCNRLGLAAGPVRQPLGKLTAIQTAALDADLDQAFAKAFGASPAR
jgi:4-hydroxy-tetrahydrodipicolinate synthase